MPFRVDHAFVFRVEREFLSGKDVVSGSFPVETEIGGFAKTTQSAGISGSRRKISPRPVASMVPPERLLIETDAPYLSPEPVRGQKCQPEFIVHTAQFLQENLNVDLEQVYQNSLAIFGINEL